MGTSKDDPRRGAYDEEQTAVTLTHHIEMQETEMTRAQFREIAGFDTEPAPGCEADDCPAVNLNWWEMVHTANLLSEQKGLEPCYRPVGCTGAFGKGLVCEGFEDPELSVYSCEGNPFGLYDLIGNTKEFQNDADRNRSSSGGVDPDGELGTRSRRVHLGCGAGSSNLVCRPTNLFGTDWDAIGNTFGFRLARTLDP